MDAKSGAAARQDSNLHGMTLTKKDVRRQALRPPDGPDSLFAKSQVGNGADAEAAPELNKALQPVFAMSERPGSV
jgi:hypothetical protein